MSHVPLLGTLLHDNNTIFRGTLHTISHDFFSAQDAPCRVGRSKKGARARIASANQYLTGPPDSCTLSVRHLVMVIF